MCKDFYFEILNCPELKKYSSRTLLGRVTEYLNDNDIDIIRYMFNKDYCNNVKHTLKKNSFSRPGYDGLVDSVRGLLATNYDNFSRFLLNYLLKAF